MTEFDSQSLSALQRLAADPSLLEHAQRTLATSSPDAVLEVLAANPSISASTQALLAKSRCAAVRLVLTRHPSLSEEMQRYFISRGSQEERDSLVCNPALSLTLRSLCAPRSSNGLLNGELDAASPVRTAPTDCDPVKFGGNFALIGPTGSGKSLTAVKLAHSCAIANGLDSVVQITIDGNDASTHTGRSRSVPGIQNITLHRLDDLRGALTALTGKHLVLIDVASQGTDDTTMSHEGCPPARLGVQRILKLLDIQMLLVLDAGQSAARLWEAVRAYDTRELAGCILTRADEAFSLQPAFDCLVRHALTLIYIGTGTSVNTIHRAHRRGEVTAIATTRVTDLPPATGQSATATDRQASAHPFPAATADAIPLAWINDLLTIAQSESDRGTAPLGSDDIGKWLANGSLAYVDTGSFAADGADQATFHTHWQGLAPISASCLVVMRAAEDASMATVKSMMKAFKTHRQCQGDEYLTFWFDKQMPSGEIRVTAIGIRPYQQPTSVSNQAGIDA